MLLCQGVNTNKKRKGDCRKNKQTQQHIPKRTMSLHIQAHTKHALRLDAYTMPPLSSFFLHLPPSLVPVPLSHCFPSLPVSSLPSIKGAERKDTKKTWTVGVFCHPKHPNSDGEVLHTRSHLDQSHSAKEERYGRCLRTLFCISWRQLPFLFSFLFLLSPFAFIFFFSFCFFPPSHSLA